MLSLHVRYLTALSSFFFFNDPATTEIYTLSLHDALPIYDMGFSDAGCYGGEISTPNLDRLAAGGLRFGVLISPDRKSTRLNSSHMSNSYAVFCLKKKKNKQYQTKLINKLHRELHTSSCAT